LAPHLAPNSCDALLDEAAGKSLRAIEELVARHFPAPAVTDLIRRRPEPRVEAAPSPPLRDVQTQPAEPAGPAVPAAPPPRPTVAPLSAEQFAVRFTADRALRDKLREAQDLLRHQIPDGNLAAILDRAVTLLLREVRKERFAVGGRPRLGAEPGPAGSRHVPAAIRRAVYARDGGQCAFVGDGGRRCSERGWLELDHVEGFARKAEHTVEGLRLLCRLHNQYAAEVMYGREFMAAQRVA
jgi:hypothetical protein